MSLRLLQAGHRAPMALAFAAAILFGPAAGAAFGQEDYEHCPDPITGPVIEDFSTSDDIPPVRRTQDVYDHVLRRFRDAVPPPNPVIAVTPIPVPPPNTRSVRLAPPALPPAPLPDFAPDEIVVVALSDADLAILLEQGFILRDESQIEGLGLAVRLLGIPQGLTLQEARDAVRALPSGGGADYNHFYRSVQAAPGTTERTLVGWPVTPTRDATCGSGAEIGMVDSGINETHVTFAGASLEVLRLPSDAETPSGKAHGTGIAALLVGDPASRSPGLVPGARLVAVDAFYIAGTDERTDAFALLEALGLLSDRGVKVINLSLAGPDNAVLAAIIGQLTLLQNTVIVAAVGNDGPDAEPAYPAGYEPVIAVTAVDQNGALYDQAVRGAHVDLSAPGVNVWTAASVKGARWKTGTSFAAPFVSAAAAILRQSQPNLSPDQVAAALIAGARDLGTPGRDPEFGAGLLNLGSLCDPGI